MTSGQGRSPSPRSDVSPCGTDNGLRFSDGIRPSELNTDEFTKYIIKRQEERLNKDFDIYSIWRRSSSLSKERVKPKEQAQERKWQNSNNWAATNEGFADASLQKVDAMDKINTEVLKKSKKRHRSKSKKHKKKSKKKHKKKKKVSSSSSESSESVEEECVLANNKQEDEFEESDEVAEFGPQAITTSVEQLSQGKGSYGGALRPGEGDAMAAFVQSGKRIPRRGEVGLDAEQIEQYESLGYVMSGSRHRRMNAVRMRKENQVYSAEEKRALAMYNYEEKANRETQLIADLRDMLKSQQESYGVQPKDN
eukprot:GHVL01002772.1.p1 GENE.GHVL01002772.1~~GHVL01002772.1.p1  ORF type:complete len:309 (+),score=70.19 GHVL01002772.1:58-984(+)